MTTPLTGQGSWFSIPVTGATLFAGGEMGSALNPEGAILIIQRAVLYTETASSVGASTINIGTAADAVTGATDIAAAVVADSGAGGATTLTDGADAKDPLIVWHAADYITVTGTSATTAFVGKLYIKYVHA